MRIAAIILSLSATAFADVFKNQKIRVGKATCTCSLNLIAIGTKLSPKSKASCDKKCNGVAKRVSLEGQSGVFTFDMAVKKGAAKLSKGSVSPATTEAPTTAGTTGGTTATIGGQAGTTGTGSGTKPPGKGSGTMPPGKGSGTMPPGKGSGSGTMPPGKGSGSGTMPPGKGSGSGPAPTGPGSGQGPNDEMQCSCKCECPDGSAQCDCDCNCPMQSMAMRCAPGFTRVCPMKNDGCPPDTDKVCPKGMEEEASRVESRMDGGASGCQCVPDFLMSLMKEDKGLELESRAGPDVFKNQKIKMGKVSCTCSLTLLAAGTKLSPKSKAVCDKKCTGKAKVVLKGRSGNVYSLDMVVKKGKAQLKGKVKPAPAATPKPPPKPTTGSPGSGSGNSGANRGPACSCVATKKGGGSGPGTPSGSGSGSPPGSASGSPPGSGAGSGSGSGETGGGNGGGDCSYPADHTMTVYPGPADECGYELKFTGLDEATKKILLDKHNELRQKVASGGEAGQPGAANMRKLVWDDELATIAQRWTSQCIFEHDKVRDLCDGTVVGQNAYQSGTDYEYYDYNVNPEIGDAVQSWYDEVTNPGFSSANINPFVFDEGYGHYTAVVWADTDRVGCGRVYYEDTDGWYKHLVVCNYAIAANLEGGVMYEEGDKCSNCPAGYSCDATFDGLCAKN